MRWIVSAAAATALAGVAYSTPLTGSAPIANDDWELIETTFGSHDIWVLNNDSDPDDGDTLRIVGLSGEDADLFGIGANGTSLVYGGPAGVYSVTYTVEDPEGNQSSATATVIAFTLVCGPVECS